jgi:hypothetical protein
MAVQREEQVMPGKAANEVLSRLGSFVGEWEVRATIGGHAMPAVFATFEWLEDGAFLRQYQALDTESPEVAQLAATMESPFPTTSIIGLDDSSNEFSMLYADVRGVFRVYQMSVSDGVWKMWRDAPGFFQRFTGTFSEDGNSITCRWEGSRDGSNWEHDFDLTYQRKQLPAL